MRSHELAQALLALPDGPLTLGFNHEAQERLEDEGLGGWELEDAFAVSVTGNAVVDVIHVFLSNVAPVATPAPPDPTMEERLQDVVDWSRMIHGEHSDRHEWCKAAAAALIFDDPLPPAGPGTAFHRRSTAEDRVKTMKRILGLPNEGD